jgi:EAL domain-containing protein (putative c-di-GMP-specific phosphodiesterase class I)
MQKMIAELGIDGAVSSIDLLRKGTLTMAFQPIVETLSGEAYGFEGLLRDTDGSPLHDIEGLFSCGCTKELLKLDMACMGSALRCGRMLPPSNYIFINANVSTLKELSRNIDAFHGFLEELQISPERIVFEISEKTDHTSVANVFECIGELLELGVRIAIDDIATSFNWLHHMLSIKPKFLKVDRTFIGGIERYTRKQALVRSLTLMTEKMGMHLIAEGIENPQELLTLKECGVPFVQGYLLGRPEAVENWLHDGKNTGGCNAKQKMLF